LVIFFLAAILSYTDRLILNILVDPISQDLHITDTQVSLLQGAAFAVLYAIISLPLGRYADNHNRRNLIVAGIAIWSVATAACGLATSFAEFFSARVCVGLGEAALAPAVMSIIPDYFPERQRGTAYGVFLTGMALGSGAAMIIGGTLLEAFRSGALSYLPIVGSIAPWRAVFLTIALPGGVIAVLALGIREPERRDTLASVSHRRASNALKITLNYFIENRWTFGCLFLAFALWNLVGYGAGAWMPSVLTRRFGMDSADVGVSIGLVTLIASGIGTLVGGIVHDRLIRSGDIARGLHFVLWASVATVPLLICPVLPWVSLILGFYFLLLLISSMAFTAGTTAIQNAVPGEMRGFSVSMQAFVYTAIGLGLGPTSIALTTEYIYADLKAVGFSIVTVSVPVMLGSVVLVWRSLRFYRITRAQMLVPSRAPDGVRGPLLPSPCVEQRTIE
jgi:MFS family permease